MTCRAFADRVDEMLDDLLPPEEARALREHSAGCADCAGELRSAEGFRALLADEGRRALAAAADREAVELARAAPEPSAPRGLLRRLPLAAAAAIVLAAAGLGSLATLWSVGGEPAPEVGDVRIARGERRLLGEGRSVVADEDVDYQVLADDGSRVRLRSGAAVFQVQRGLPFVVETELGDAEVRGTLFHVSQRTGGPASVAVLSGSVVFVPRHAGPRRTLRAGAVLDVAPDGRQRLVTRADVADLELRVEMQDFEIEALRGDLERMREELEAAVDAMPTDAPADAATSDAQRWSEIGATMHRLVALRPDPYDPRWFRAMYPLIENSRLLQEATGARELRDWYWHPAVVARTAGGFLQSVSPAASPSDRARAAAMVESSAATALGELGEDPLPSALASARLAMIREMIGAARDLAGVEAAATLVRTHPSREIWLRLPYGPDETVKTQTLAFLTRSFELTDEQQQRTGPLVDAWLAAHGAARAAAEAEWGAEFVRETLAPPDFGRGANAGARPQPDDATLVDAYLRKLDVRRRLLEPRVAFEAAFRELLTPEQRARSRPDDSETQR